MMPSTPRHFRCRPSPPLLSPDQAVRFLKRGSVLAHWASLLAKGNPHPPSSLGEPARLESASSGPSIQIAVDDGQYRQSDCHAIFIGLGPIFDSRRGFRV
jgi:hypothetical protein